VPVSGRCICSLNGNVITTKRVHDKMSFKKKTSSYILLLGERTKAMNIYSHIWPYRTIKFPCYLLTIIIQFLYLI
jgi:hypothetical protein